MLSSFHKTASECWRRTPETQKGSPFSSKGGRTNYRRRKSYGWRSTLRRELWRRRSFQQKKFLTETEVSGRGNPLTDRSVGSFGISEGNITGRKKKQYPRENAPKHNSQRKSSPDALIHQQWAGAGQGGTGCMLRVRTRPECPEDNLSELMWDSNPNFRIAREKKKKKLRKRTFLWKALI